MWSYAVRLRVLGPEQEKRDTPTNNTDRPMVDSGSPDIAERILSTRRDLSEPEEAVIRLKKVVASKDAQVEALTSRIEKSPRPGTCTRCPALRNVPRT